MFDYGVDPAADAMFLVLKDYRCSLKWAAAAAAAAAVLGAVVPGACA